MSLGDAVRVWFRIACVSFGGPAAQIAVMHRILVDERRWISERRFLHALNYCMLLPGPEAQQLVTYAGWLMHGTLGGLIAGGLFVLPGAVSIMALSLIYAAYGELPVVVGVFFGLKPAVLAIVLAALLRLGRRAMRNRAMLTLAGVSFLAIHVFNLPFPAIIAAAFAIGWIGGRLGLPAFQAADGHGAAGTGLTDADSLLGETLPAHARPMTARTLGVATTCLVLWLLPTALLLLLAGADNVFADIALFFTKMAVVTFGGAYSVLAYVAQEAVQTYQWLRPGEMLDGLGMAETTPGPLIMVLQFVGFLAAFHSPGELPPLVAGALAGMLATWVTFAPCFLWVFLGAPYVEALRGRRALNAGMSAITAAVVGVILNLAVWFALHTLFRVTTVIAGPFWRLELPVLSSVHWASVLLTAAAILAVFRFGVGIITVLVSSALAGALLSLGGLAG